MPKTGSTTVDIMYNDLGFALTHVDTKAALHRTMKSQLDFPDRYGENWDAFWNAFLRLVKMPDCVVLQD